MQDSFSYFFNQLISGISLGFVYGLIAIGYTMVYGIVGMINFAHGEIFMIGAFVALIAYFIMEAIGLGWVPIAILAMLMLSMLINGFYGWTLERVAYRPLRGSSRLAPLITAIGMSIFLQNFVQLLQGARPRPLQPLIPGHVELWNVKTPANTDYAVQISYAEIMIIIITVLLMTVFTIVITRTPLGRAQRACEQDQKMASLLGINVDRTIAMTFIIGAVLAAVAGLIYTLRYGSIDFFIGFHAGVKAFTAAVLGGIGSLPGAMLGGALIGLIETFFAGYAERGSEYKDVAVFTVLVVVLIFRPTGLLGKPDIEKVYGMQAALRPLDLRAMLKEAALTAFVVFMLAIVLVGFELRDVPGAIALFTRFPDVFACVVLAFLGRIAIVLLREGRTQPVIIGAGVVIVVLLIGLLPETLFGTDTAVRIARRFMPFEAVIVRWCLLSAAVFLFLRAALAQRSADTAKSRDREAAADAMGARVQSIARYAGPLLGFLAVAMPVAFRNDQQVMSVAILVMTYIMLGWGLNIVVGLAGLLDLGYVAFYAVGAYTFALLATTPGLELSFWVCLPIAGMLAGLVGVLLGFPVLRLRGDYLAIVTLGFGEIIRVVIQNWYGFTNGANGISGIPRPTLFGLSWDEEAPEGQTAFHKWVSDHLFAIDYNATHEKIFLYYIILMLALIVNWFAIRARGMPIGRAWEALREDEIACRSLGINPTNTKLTAFGVGAMFGGFAGAFFATSQGFVSPESFVFIELAIILAVVVLGGFGSQLGVVLAALLLIGLPEAFREVKDFRMAAFGLAMVVIMLWRPAGLLAHREPTVRLKAGTAGKAK